MALPLSSLSLRFISSAWLKSSNSQSVFLWSVPPTIPSIWFYFKLWFSLQMDLSFSNEHRETHQLGELGHSHKTVYVGGAHFKGNFGGSVCTTCFMAVFVCRIFTMRVGNWCFCVSLRLYQKEADRGGLLNVCEWAACPFSCSLSLHVLVWCGAVINWLLRCSSSSTPGSFPCVCQFSVWQLAWHGTAWLSFTSLVSASMAYALCHNNTFNSAGIISTFNVQFCCSLQYGWRNMSLIQIFYCLSFFI